MGEAGSRGETESQRIQDLEAKTHEEPLSLEGEYWRELVGLLKRKRDSEWGPEWKKLYRKRHDDEDLNYDSVVDFMGCLVDIIAERGDDDRFSALIAIAQSYVVKEEVSEEECEEWPTSFGKRAWQKLCLAADRVKDIADVEILQETVGYMNVPHFGRYFDSMHKKPGALKETLVKIAEAPHPMAS